jgi:MEMO1 family protein
MSTLHTPTIRPPAVAGLFYPAAAHELEAEVKHYLEQGRLQMLQDDVLTQGAVAELKALIVPHAGYVYSGKTAGRAYAELARLAQKPRKILMLGPAHRVYVPHISVAAVQAYQTPLGLVKVSPVALDLARQYGYYPEVHRQEHALEVQLPFLQCLLPDFEIIPIVIGGASAEQLAEQLMPYLDAETLVLVSTDLSHFLSDEKARAVDHLANTSIAALDQAQFSAQGDACGKTGVLVAMALAKKYRWSSFFLDYTNSADASGDRSRVVGYGAYAMGITNHKDHQL